MQASAAKRRGEEDEEVEEDIPWGTRPGMILEVSMRNFMCHQVQYSSGFLLKLVHVSTLDLHFQAEPEADVPLGRERVRQVCSPHGHCLCTRREW